MTLIKRERYLEKIRRFYDSNLIKVLTGVRRCGKSVLLSQIQGELLKRGIPANHIIYLSLEDAAYAKIKRFDQLNDFLLSKMTDEDKYYVFLDEIQHIIQFEKVLASLKATRNISLFVTGSNSNLLSGRLATLLVGRCKEFRIFPFSYAESLAYYSANGLPLPEKPFQDYLRFGGMPQRFDYDNEEDIKDYLHSIFYGVIDKDICGSHSKIDRESFLTVSKYIISNAPKEFSAQKVADFYNAANPDKIYRMLVYRYLNKLEQACLISRINRYDVAGKRTLRHIEKQFAVDNGFILACADSNQVSAAHTLENLAFNELVYRGYEVKIGKTYKGEIGFVAMKGGKKCFIQVAYYLLSDDVIQREFGAFDSVRDSSPKFVLSLDDYDMSKDGITHLNIEKWLTGKVDLMLS